MENLNHEIQLIYQKNKNYTKKKSMLFFPDNYNELRKYFLELFNEKSIKKFEFYFLDNNNLKKIFFKEKDKFENGMKEFSKKTNNLEIYITKGDMEIIKEEKHLVDSESFNPIKSKQNNIIKEEKKDEKIYGAINEQKEEKQNNIKSNNNECQAVSVPDLQKTIQNLEQEIIKLRNQLDESKNEKLKLEEKIEKLESTINEKNKKILEYNYITNEKDIQYTQTLGRLNLINFEFEKLKERNRRLGEKINVLSKMKEDMIEFLEEKYINLFKEALQKYNKDIISKMLENIKESSLINHDIGSKMNIRKMGSVLVGSL